MFDVFIADKAKTDIRTNAEWWKEHRSTEQADQWLTGIADAIESLEQMPRRCGLAAEADVLGISIRNLYFGLSSHPTHRVLFTVDENVVNVLRVLSTRQARIRSTSELH